MRDAIRTQWIKYQDISSYLLSGLGLLFYAQKSWGFIHTLASIVFDESGYMAKGFLLASGKFSPYADYSILLDHMPLSFLIPGYIQVLFGPGIRTGRYFSFGVGIIALVGLWIAARKLGGKWWGAIAVWVMALNPVWIESNSLGFSQVLIFFFTTWSLVFAIGEEKKPWEIFLSSFLAGLAGMTRLNMFPIVFLLILFFYWQHGKKLGTISLIGGIAPILILHYLYWPGILRMWAFYFPEGVFPLVDSYRFPMKINYLPEGFTISGWLSNPNHLMWNIVRSFWKGIQNNLIVVTGVLATIFLWPSKKKWKSDYQQKLALFFLVTYLILFLMHMGAAMSGASCSFSCFKGYLMFFTNIGIFLVILTYRHWEKTLPLWRNFLIGVFTSFYLLELVHWNNTWQRTVLRGVRALLKIEIPRIPSQDTVTLWGAFEKIFAVESNLIEQYLYNFAYWAIPLIFIWLLIPLVLQRLRKFVVSFRNFGWYLLVSLLVLIGFLSPLKIIGGELNSTQCNSSVLDSHEIVGERLNSRIPPGSLVYWDLKSWMMLLYIPEIEIFAPQTWNHYSYVPSIYELDQEFLLRYGYWDEVLKEKWIHEADFILVEGRNYKDAWRPRVEHGELELVDITPEVEVCRGDNSRILILQNSNEETN